MNSISAKTLDGDRGLLTHLPTQDTESEVYSVTTASPMNMPNHQPILKGLLLHEHLLTRDFQGDQHFFRKDGSVARNPTMPGFVSAPNAGDAVTQIVPHEDAPAFSDIATTATEPATSPLTTHSPTTPGPPVPLPQKKSPKEKMQDSGNLVPTTDSLTTQVTQYSRGPSTPVASLSSRERDSLLDVTPGPFSTIKEKEKLNPDSLISKIPSSFHEEVTSVASTTVITTTITTMQTSEPCSMNFTESEGNIEIQQHVDPGVECNYLITVYLGYGIEVQVSAKNFNVGHLKTF
ncbi:hypothetical protein ILYODFUR_019612 [Ilyodon furcidens]|uniref:Uncharacterized protein n=1 Tax=Ilyodon furcidens TaxID=33524 RepID=A0ABV0SMP9_9TELE